MSDDAVAATPSPVDEPPQSRPNLLVQYRLHLIIAAAVISLLFSLLAGVAIGMAKRHFEKKFYLEQIEKLKDSLSDVLERNEELGKELKELKIDLRAKQDHVADLESKIKSLERKAKSVEKSAPAAATSRESEVSGSGDAGVDYLRLKAGDCVVDGSSAATATKWRECLQKAKKSPGSAH